MLGGQFPGEIDFQEGVARIEVYEETDIHKEAFVREEVRVRKVVNMTRLKPKKLFVEKS